MASQGSMLYVMLVHTQEIDMFMQKNCGSYEI
jgi:hypothetical protein